MALNRPPDPRALLRRAGLAAKKSWGQNFLCDQNILAIIAAATGAGPELPVVELGAGLGALTYHLLQRGGRVLAVERDRELAPLLREALVPPGGTAGEAGEGARLEIVEADAATLDYRALARRLGTAPMVCGNLPYQLSSRIVVELSDQVDAIRGAVLMLQREVAQRLAATPGGRAFGLLSVLVQRAFRVESVRTVSPGAFHPRPKVTSAVVRLVPRDRRLAGAADARLVAAARAAFATRRKTLKNSLRRGLSADAEVVTAAIREAALEPEARAETLAVEDFARLGEALAARGLLG